MALVDLKSNLANFRADFSHESKLKSPGNTPGSMPIDIQKKSPNNVPTQRYINEIKVDPVIKPKISTVNPIKTQLKDKVSNIVTITTSVKDKKSTIAPLQTVLNDKTSQVDPLKTEVKIKASQIAPLKALLKDKISQVAPLKTEVKDKTSNIATIQTLLKDKNSAITTTKTEVKDKESKIVTINTVIKAKESSIKASAFSTPDISKQHHEVKPKYNKNVLEIGTYKIDNQLGSTGSPFKYLKSGALTTKKFSDKGYSDKRRYDDSVKSVKGQPGKSLLYAKGMEQNSPSAIDAEYAKYNLQDDSFNPTYMKQPFIVRPIGKRWGFKNSPGAFDDGLIRGGMTTAIERSALDTARIAKWMASPKGLLWVVKQIGLGLTNPKVEAIGGALTRQTRIHSGLASLLSVPTTAFGIHFTRHGVPFLNATSSYGNVIDSLSSKGNTTYSRLINLKSELFAKDIPGTPTQSKFVTDLIQKVGPLRKAIGFTGMPIVSLSGLAGPGSVYGIGLTTIKRHYNSRNLPNDKTEAPAENKTSFINPSSLSKPYASDKIGFSGTAESGGTYESKLKNIGESKNFGKTQTPGASSNGIKPSIETADNRNSSYPEAKAFGINNYVTTAYNKIKKSSDIAAIPNDFRNDLEITNQKFSGKAEDTKYYEKYDIQNKTSGYGLGTPGRVGKDRSKPNTFIKKGNDFSFKTADNRNILTSNAAFEGDMITGLDIGGGDDYPTNHKDFIKFYFEDATQGKNIMAFRATLNGFTDSFSPGWDAIAIMGRPDSAYLYSSFERSVSFNFTVAATTRSEMIPMWRKLNYLSTYTMPDLVGGSKPSGPMMRFTIGDLFHRTAGFISSLSYTIPDDATWDIAEDSKDQVAKQLPMMMEVSMALTVIGDYRPQKMGRAYSLSPKGGVAEGPGNWIGDADTK